MLVAVPEREPAPELTLDDKRDGAGTELDTGYVTGWSRDAETEADRCFCADFVSWMMLA